MSPRRDRHDTERTPAGSTSGQRPSRESQPTSAPTWPDEADQVIEAIRAGEVDAFVIRGPLGEQIYTLSGAVEAYRIILEGIQEGVVTLGLDGRIAFAGRRLASMLDVPLAELVGRRLEDFVQGDGQEPFATFLERAAQGPVKAEFHVAPRGGEVLPVFMAARPFDADGLPCLCIVVTDLSEQHMQQRLRASEERFRLAARASRDVIFEWNLGREGEVWVDPSHEVFGETVESHPARWWAARIHPEDLARVVREVEEAAAGGAGRWESAFRLRRNDGTHAHVLTRALIDCDAGGRPRRMIGAMSDVTRERQAQSDLAFLADLGGLLVGARERDEVVKIVTSRLLAFLSVDGCALRIRPVAEPGVGGPSAEPAPIEQRLEWLGREELASGRAFVAEEIAPEQAEGAGVPGVRSCACIPCMEGAHWRGTLVAWRGAPHAWETRELALLQTAADRAWVALANATLNDELARSSRQKDDFLAILSHELRNPLNPLKVAAELLRDGEPEDLPEISGIIERQVDQLGRLLDDLLDVARITRGRVELRRVPVILRDVVAQAVESVRPAIAAKGQSVDVSAPTELLRVWADPVRMVQILANLVDNASKYSAPGRRIQVEARSEEGEAVLSVHDEGRGIEPEMLPRIFDLFVREDRAQREMGGLGIGLHLVKQLVDLHGGQVQAVSAGIGQGSTFSLRLPLLETVNDGVEQAVVPSDAGAGCRVLVADDHRDAAASLALWLRSRGHDVRVVHDGHAALEVAGPFAPEVVVLDLGMPELDGFEAARGLRDSAEGARAMLVAVSGYTDADSRRRAAEAGFDHHLSKPVDLTKLAALVSDYLEGRAGRAPG